MANFGLSRVSSIQAREERTHVRALERARHYWDDHARSLFFHSRIPLLLLFFKYALFLTTRVICLFAKM